MRKSENPEMHLAGVPIFAEWIKKCYSEAATLRGFTVLKRDRTLASCKAESGPNFPSPLFWRRDSGPGDYGLQVNG
jgi:hypothetical protein